jgi:hypothetical protein
MGGLVAPVPLIHIPDETILDMHPIEAYVLNSVAVEEEDKEPEHIYLRESSEKVGIQLLLNYCWGHPKSAMLFLPVGAIASYINHAPSKDKVNAKMVWSEHAENNDEWLEYPLQPFADMGSLVVEIVATKDIKEGEEGTLKLRFRNCGSCFSAFSKRAKLSINIFNWCVCVFSW